MCMHVWACVSVCIKYRSFFEHSTIGCVTFRMSICHRPSGLGGRETRTPCWALEEFETCGGFYTESCCIKDTDKCVVSRRFFNEKKEKRRNRSDPKTAASCGGWSWLQMTGLTSHHLYSASWNETNPSCQDRHQCARRSSTELMLPQWTESGTWRSAG